MTAGTSARPGADASMDAHRATAEGDHMNDQAPPTADRADRAVTIRSLVKRYGELMLERFLRERNLKYFTSLV